MSVASVRGGVPHVFRATIDGTGRKHSLPHYAMFMVIRVAAGSNALKVYFTEADFNADANYVQVEPASATYPYGEWRGPVEAGDVWLKSVGASSATELVSFQRRG